MITELIREIAKDHLQLETVDDDTPLFGPDSSLDSLGLVSVLTDVESRIYDEFKVEIVIASDRAMSQTRSPFRTVGSLTLFVEDLVKELQ